VRALAEMMPNALVQDRSVSQDPASNRGVIDAQTTLYHHLFQISITERIAKIPPYAQHDHLILKVPSLEYRRPVPSHSATLTARFFPLRHYRKCRGGRSRAKPHAA
jgi:hypothetical protein